MPINLIVPFTEKDDAKKLGAKWNQNDKTWYIPETITDISVFNKWIKEENPQNSAKTKQSVNPVNPPSKYINQDIFDKSLSHLRYFKHIAKFGLYEEYYNFDFRNFYFFN